MNRLNRIVAVILSTTLVWTSGQMAEAMVILRSPESVPGFAYINFRRNQERMRLETQAMTLQIVDAHPMLQKVPFLARLLNNNRSRISSEEESSTPLPTASHDPVRPRFFRSVALTSLLTALVSVGMIFAFPSQDPTEAVLKGFLYLFGMQAVHVMILSFFGVPMTFLNLTTLHCGVDGTDQKLNAEQQQIPYSLNPIPQQTSELSLAQGEVTVMRGMHAAGASIRVQYRKDGRKHYKILTAKVVCAKRDYLPELLEAKIQQTIAREHLLNQGIEYPERFIILKHFRYSTGSDPNIVEETHPHLGEAPRKAMLYRQEISADGTNGRRVQVEEEVVVSSTHNGDFDGMRWFDDQDLSEGQFKAIAAAAMRDPNHPKEHHPATDLDGDSPTGAMLVAMLRTQYDAYASVRLGALQTIPREFLEPTVIERTVGHDVQGNSIIKKRYEPRLLTPEVMLGWQKIFEGVINALPDEVNLATLDEAAIRDLKRQMLSAFQSAVQQNHYLWAAFPHARLEAMVNASVDNFLQNDLYRAMQIFAERAVSSFGMGILSSVDEDPVFFAKQQPFALARNRTTHQNGWNSEQRSLTIETKVDGQWAYEDRLDLKPYGGGEVARLRADGSAEVWEVATRRHIPTQEIADRWFNMEESPFTAPMRRRIKDKPATLSDVEDQAFYLKEAETMWANPKSFNRIVAGNIYEQLHRLAAYQQKHGSMPPGAHIALVGFWTDRDQAQMLIDSWKEQMPHLSGLNIELVPSNDVLENPELALKKHGLSKETIVLVVDYFGQQFPTINAASFLIRYCPYTFGITGGVEGDLDNPLAVAMGQNLKKGSPLAGNVITTGSPWPSTQAMFYCETNMMATLNHLFLRLADDLDRDFPKSSSPRDGGRPFDSQLDHEDIEEIRDAMHAEIEVVSRVTGVGADRHPLPAERIKEGSNARHSLLLEAKNMSHEFSEPRVMRYLYRILVLAVFIGLLDLFGIAPHDIPGVPSLLHFLSDWSLKLIHVAIGGPLYAGASALDFLGITSQHLSGIPPFTAHWGGWGLKVFNWGFDYSFFTMAHLIILFVLRKSQGRTVLARQGIRFVGISAPEIGPLAKNIWKICLGLSYPDATANVVSGDSVGAVKEEAVKEMKPYFSRGSRMINIQTDADLPSLKQRADAITTSGKHSKVERSAPTRTLINFLNWALDPFYDSQPIPFAGVKVLTIGRQWDPNINAEDSRITLPTVHIYLPRPWNTFLRNFESHLRGHGHPEFSFSGPQRRLFLQAMNRLDTEVLNDALHHSDKLAETIGVPDHGLRQEFQRQFVAAAKAGLLHLSEEDRARRERIERFIGKRVYAIGDLAALNVLGEEAVRLTNSPELARNRRAPTGFTQSAAVIDTTKTPVSATLVAGHAHKRIELHNFSTRVIWNTESQVNVEASGEDPAFVATIVQPNGHRNGGARAAGMRLLNPRLNLQAERPTIRIRHDLQDVMPGAGAATLRVTLETVRGPYTLTVSLSTIPRGEWYALEIPTAEMPFKVVQAPALSCTVSVEGAEGELRIPASAAPTAEAWIESVAAAEVSTSERRLSFEKLDDLLGEWPPSSRRRGPPNTTLLMKNGSESNLRWDRIVVDANGSWNTRDERVSETDRQILDRLFDHPVWSAPDGKPVLVEVAPVTGRAAISEHFPAGSRLAGKITLDADLVEDVRRGVPFAFETARLELVEEMAELAQPPTARRDDRFDLEVRMLWEKTRAFLKLDPVAQAGVIDYLRTHRLLDPDDLALSTLFESAARTLSEIRAGLHAGRKVVDLLHGDLQSYVRKAFAYETQRSAPTDGVSGKAHRRFDVRIPRWAWIAIGVAGFALVIGSVLYLYVMWGVPTPDFQSLPRPAVPDWALQVTREAVDTSLRHMIHVDDARFRTMGHIVLEIKKSHPELADYLAGPLWGSQGAVQRVWEVIGGQSLSGNVQDLVAGKDQFDLTPLLEKARSLHRVSAQWLPAPAATVSRTVFKGMWSTGVAISLSSLAIVFAGAVVTSKSRADEDGKAPEGWARHDMRSEAGRDLLVKERPIWLPHSGHLVVTWPPYRRVGHGRTWFFRVREPGEDGSGEERILPDEVYLEPPPVDSAEDPAESPVRRIMRWTPHGFVNSARRSA